MYEENCCRTYLTPQKSVLDTLLNSCQQPNNVLTACMNCLSISDGEQQVLHNLLIFPDIIFVGKKQKYTYLPVQEKSHLNRKYSAVNSITIFHAVLL